MSRPPLSQDLERIRTLFLQMFVRAESMTQQAVRSLIQRDPHMARAVTSADEALDDLEVEIDRLCVRYLALARPSGYELRLVTTVLKMVTDLERMGDLAVNIAERGLDLGAGPGLEPGESLPRMGDAVVRMIRLAADGFVQGDARVHDELRARDDEVDDLNREAFRHWLGVMAAHPDQADRAMSFTSVSRYLERIADHAVNLGQMIVLLVEGRDVRHL
ncbi:MAG: phosphate signaling complex protein PhoU [Alphaproteobacteria bacterium]|nr:phosphate signaling complex protein PhoU [Alphaproteobacteria bacterium]